jgi:YVTN family beta-propeller protein
MKKCYLLLILLFAACFVTLHAQRVQLPNGWSLSPAGSSIPLSSDLPLNIALSPDGIHAAITNNGNGVQCIDLVNLKEKKVVFTKVVKDAWLGLAFSRNYLYASGGNDDIIIRYRLTGDSLAIRDTLVLGAPWPANKISPAGLCVDEKKQRLYVVTKEDNALYVCNTHTMKKIKRVPLSAEAYTCLLNPKSGELYISGWGGRKIWIFNTTSETITDSIATGDHPCDMALSGNGKWLYVANANSNSVSVINVAARRVAETLNTAIAPDAPIGSTTNSVALSPDNKTLYIANADNNYLAVFDVSVPGSSHSKGFIPVGWYPTCVRTSGGRVLVANGKGMSSFSNVVSPKAAPSTLNLPYKKSASNENAKPEVLYIGNMLKGTLSVIPVPSAAVQSGYTRQVYANTPYTKEKSDAREKEAGNAFPVKYIFYVLKENRTYDQVLGDMAEGNGDSALCLFGKKVTPNEHALAREFGLLDNFYVDAEVSADGHNWSMAAYATDFTEKTWPTNYRGGGGKYDFDGSRPIANPTRGFIWDYCERAGVSFRNYGEFMDNGPPSYGLLKDKKNYCHAYPGWNLDIQDVARERVFEHDFDSLVAINQVPHFNTVYLPNDHTSGLAKGAYTPVAQVADNDLALGRLVDHISHSPIWKESAIFVLEDDAQDGPDHVDAHRSIAWVISPYSRRKVVNHSMYSTSGMLRTIELILGLPPMSQYDAAAVPMWNCFQAAPDTTPYTALDAQVDINARNSGSQEKEKTSYRFNFKSPDLLPDRLLNNEIWKSVKGNESLPPEPRRSAFVWVAGSDKD